MRILNNILLAILMNLAIVLGASAGPGNPTGGFGNSERSLFGLSENDYSILSEGPEDGESPDLPPAIPIDGGIGFILLGGLMVGGRTIMRRITGASK